MDSRPRSSALLFATRAKIKRGLPVLTSLYLYSQGKNLAESLQFKRLVRKFYENKVKWKLLRSFSFGAPFTATSEKFAVTCLEHDVDPNVTPLEETTKAIKQHRYAIPLFLSGLLLEVYSRIEKGKKVRPLNSTRMLIPLHAGQIPEAETKGGKYAVAHTVKNGAYGLRLHYRLEKQYKRRRTFLFFPHPEHADHFALASADSSPSYVNSEFPFAVGYAQVEEGKSHVVIDCVQSNYGSKNIRKAGVFEKSQVMPGRIERQYSHWRRILLRHVVEYYLKRGKTIVFPNVEQYKNMWANVSEKSADAIAREVEKAAEFHKCTVRELTAQEVTRLKLSGAAEKFKVVERKI